MNLQLYLVRVERMWPGAIKQVKAGRTAKSHHANFARSFVSDWFGCSDRRIEDGNRGREKEERSG